MIDDVKDIEDVIEDIDFEDEEKVFLNGHSFSKEEADAYELGLQTIEAESNPYNEKTQKDLYDAFNMGWHFGR